MGLTGTQRINYMLSSSGEWRAYTYLEISLRGAHFRPKKKLMTFFSRFTFFQFQFSFSWCDSYKFLKFSLVLGGHMPRHIKNFPQIYAKACKKISFSHFGGKGHMPSVPYPWVRTVKQAYSVAK